MSSPAERANGARGEGDPGGHHRDGIWRLGSLPSCSLSLALAGNDTGVRGGIEAQIKTPRETRVASGEERRAHLFTIDEVYAPILKTGQPPHAHARKNISVPYKLS
jgi:hypothetical protein